MRRQAALLLDLPQEPQGWLHLRPRHSVSQRLDPRAEARELIRSTRAADSEENLEVKARKRLAREQKARYKALGINPPPKLNVGRRGWERTIRFEEQKLRGIPEKKKHEDQAKTGDSSTEEWSPEGFSTSTWRIGDVVRQAAYEASTPETLARFEPVEQPTMPLLPPPPPPFVASGVPQALPTYAFPPPLKQFSGPIPAYSPYPLTPPMDDDFQPIQTIDGNNALGLFSPPVSTANVSDWITRAHATAHTMPPVYATARVPSLNPPRAAAFQPAPKPIAPHFPPQPDPLAYVPQAQQVACVRPPPIPYPSPQTSHKLLPVALPPAPVPAMPEPVRLYAPNPLRPAATCSFIARIGTTPPPPPPQAHEASPTPKYAQQAMRFQPGPQREVPGGGESPAAAYASHDQHTIVQAGRYAEDSQASFIAPAVTHSSSWQGAQHASATGPNPTASVSTAYNLHDTWPLYGSHAHSTPEVYSHVW